MANENFTQFADGGVLQATDYLVGYRGGAEAKILGSNILAYIISNALALANGSTATTQTSGDNSTKIATTAFVQAAVGGGGGVTSIAGTAGQVVASASTGAVTLSLAAALTGINSITSATGQPLTLAALDTAQNIILNPGFGVAGASGAVVINTSAYNIGHPSLLITEGIGGGNGPIALITNTDTGGYSGWYASNSDGTRLEIACQGASSGDINNIASNTALEIYAGTGFPLSATFSSTGIAVNGTVKTTAGITYDFGAASNVAAAGLTALNLTKQILHIVGGVSLYIPCATSPQ